MTEQMTLSKKLSAAALAKLIADCNLALARLDSERKVVEKFRSGAKKALAEVNKAKGYKVTFVRKQSKKRS